MESFRRFLAASESAHAEDAAHRGIVREYTAWAVALDQLDRWSRAVAVATGTPGHASFAALASRLLDPLHDAASYSGGGVSGSSAGGGGGDGVGAVGGGQGGGGGGSW